MKESFAQDPFHLSVDELNKIKDKDIFDPSSAKNYNTDCSQTMPGFVLDKNFHSTIRNHRV